LDKFIQIIEENNLSPGDIEKVEFTPHPITSNRMMEGAAGLRTEEDFGFHEPYLIACAAHRIKRTDFLNLSVRNDSKIREFMTKVKPLPIPHEDFGLAVLQDAFAMVHPIEVRAKGKTFQKTSQCDQWVCALTRLTDKELVEKFEELASDFLPMDRIDEATKNLLDLENLQHVNDLMEMLRP
jgi:hypothetical protein